MLFLNFNTEIYDVATNIHKHTYAYFYMHTDMYTFTAIMLREIKGMV